MTPSFKENRKLVKQYSSLCTQLVLTYMFFLKLFEAFVFKPQRNQFERFTLCFLDGNYTIGGLLFDRLFSSYLDGILKKTLRIFRSSESWINHNIVFSDAKICFCNKVIRKNMIWFFESEIIRFLTLLVSLNYGTSSCLMGFQKLVR